MSTDTALALGLLAVLGRDVPDRVRAFLLTVFVVDDVAALVVIAVVYSDSINVGALALALLFSPSCWWPCDCDSPNGRSTRLSVC